MPAPQPENIEGANLPDARRVKAAVGVPVICTGGFQTASVIAAALARGDCDAVSVARPLIANNDLVEIFRRGQDRAERPCTYCNKCLVNVVENPLGCYEEARFPSREAMIAEIMSVFRPEAVRRAGDRDMSDDLIEPDARDASKIEPVVRAAAARLPWSSWSRCATSCARRTCTTPRSRRSQRRIPADTRSGGSRRPRPSTARYNDLQLSRRWEPSGCRFGRNVPLEHVFPDTAEPADSQSARGQPRADDARRVPAGDDPEPAGGVVDSVHGARLVRAQAVDDRRDRHPDGAGRRLGAIRRSACRKIGARAGAGRIDAAAGLRQPEQPLVGRVADLRLRSGDWRRSCARRSAASCGSSRPACCRSIPRPACTSPGSPTTGGSAWRCSTRCSRWSTTTSATCSRTSIRTGTTTSSSRRQADQLGADGEDPHRRVDAGDRAAPDHPAGA